MFFYAERIHSDYQVRYLKKEPLSVNIPVHEKSFLGRRAISSVGERFLHTEEVAGSKPASPTISINKIHYLPKFGDRESDYFL
jgi:hypothetical protein